MIFSFDFSFSLEKEILDRYLEVVLKGNKDGLKVTFELQVLQFRRIKIHRLLLIFFGLDLVASLKQIKFNILDVFRFLRNSSDIFQ